MKKAIILYCSITGNTQKVAKAIDNGLKDKGTVNSFAQIDITAW